MTARPHALIVSALWETTNQLGVALATDRVRQNNGRRYGQSSTEVSWYECQADSSNTVSVVIAQVAQAMLLEVQDLVLSAKMLCFHLHTRSILLVHRRRHVFSGCNIQGEKETMIGSEHAEFM